MENRSYWIRWLTGDFTGPHETAEGAEQVAEECRPEKPYYWTKGRGIHGADKYGYAIWSTEKGKAPRECVHARIETTKDPKVRA